MFFQKKKFVFSLIAFLVLVIYQRIIPTRQVLSEQIQPQPTTAQEQSAKQQAQIIRVVDGDTDEVLLNGQKEKVRIIGINTPETVDPRRPVQCFGKEASDYAKKILTGQNVSLESDSTQSDRDKYGRLLRYIVLNNGADFGLMIIADGYAHDNAIAF